MVALAGSIGIIGIALILAVSAGMTNYINTMQSESLSSYPITVSSIAVNMDEASNVLSGIEEGNETSNDSIVVYDPASTLIKMGKFNYLGKQEGKYIVGDSSFKFELNKEYLPSKINFNKNKTKIEFNIDYSKTSINIPIGYDIFPLSIGQVKNLLRVDSLADLF